MRTETLTFTNKRNQKIAGISYIANPEEKNATVIFAHGFGVNYRPLQHHGEGYANNGINCIFFDFCGGGPESLSEGTMLDMTVPTEIEDLESVIEGVCALPYVDETRLFLQGESMGGFISSIVASGQPDKIKGLVLWYPAFVIPDGSRERFERGDDMCFGMQVNPDFNRTSMDIDIYSIIGKYKGPVLMIHGDKDEIVPIEYSRRALKVYENAELVEIRDSNHGFGEGDSEYAAERSVGFVQKNSQ